VANLVKVFPSLAHRPLYLTGESYAGVYIVRMLFVFLDDSLNLARPQPYITKGYFSLAHPPTRLAKIAIGNGAMGPPNLFQEAAVVWTLHHVFVSSAWAILQPKVLETYPQLIGYDPEVFNYFVEQ
jgi:carboxypeptidase D